MTGFFWTLETTTTDPVGMCTGTVELKPTPCKFLPVPDQHWKPGRNAKKNAGKPPRPLKKLRRKKKFVLTPVLYLDDDYWDARMVDVE